ncbi:MAG: DUF1905 domain-containing protein [Alphaproteobacteria bacterium]|nr:DUF1905 domain-containing protein [Alphaproteobacteria bacterium]
MAAPHEYRMKAKVWLYPGKATWYFVTLPKRQSTAIRTLFGGMKRGWGSLPVAVTIGKTRWTTSIFPDSKAGAYILPLKAEIRDKEAIRAGMTVHLRIEIRL